MIEYNKGNLRIKSDLEIRPMMEKGSDIDLIIPIDYMTINLHIQSLPDYIDDRIQLLKVGNILIRFSTEKGNDYCTIHFLRDIDIQSAVMNFIFDYRNHHIRLERKEYSVAMYIE